MDEYHELEVAYFADGGSGNAAKDAKMRGLYEYVNLLKVPSAPSQHVKYMLLVELARIFVEDRTERVIKKLLDYKTIKESSVEIERLVQIAGNYADDFARMDTQSVDAQGSVRDALLSLADSLESDFPDSVENAAYEAVQTAHLCKTFADVHFCKICHYVIMILIHLKMEYPQIQVAHALQ